MKIKLQLFGAFRKYGSEIELDIPNDSIISDLRESLAKMLGDGSRELINSSRFATDNLMLNDKDKIGDSKINVKNEITSLAIIPPVSGG